MGLSGRRIACSVSSFLTDRAEAGAYHQEVALARRWANVGEWLEQNTLPDRRIATIVPGAIGYFSQRPVIDMLGLTDRVVALHGSVYRHAGHDHARYNTDYVFEREPDIVLYHSSGRFLEPIYADSQRISHRHGYALFDFVTDPRCIERYRYHSVQLTDGTWLEMQRKLANPPPD